MKGGCFWQRPFLSGMGLPTYSLVMTAQNWLYNYRFKEGIFKSFAGLSHRASYMCGAGNMLCELFEANYSRVGGLLPGILSPAEKFRLSGAGAPGSAQWNRKNWIIFVE